MYRFTDIQIIKREINIWELETLSEVIEHLNSEYHNYTLRFDFKFKDDLEVFRARILTKALTKKVKIKTELEGLSLYVSKK